MFTNGKQRAEVTRPATKAALGVLMETWPRAIEVDALSAIALEGAAAFLDDTTVEDARSAMLEDLFGGAMYGLIVLHTQPPACTNRPSDTPRAHPVAAFQAQSGNLVVNAHHDMLQLEALSLEVLKLANGSRRRSDILDTLVEWFESGRLEMEDDGQPITNPGAAREILSDRLEKALTTLTRRALLIE